MLNCLPFSWLALLGLMLEVPTRRHSLHPFLTSLSSAERSLLPMQSPSSFSEASRPFLTWQRILDWAQEHYRCRTFSKDERIPARPGLLYLVQRGAIRMVGTAQVSATASQAHLSTHQQNTRRSFSGFCGS